MHSHFLKFLKWTSVCQRTASCSSFIGLYLHGLPIVYQTFTHKYFDLHYAFFYPQLFMDHIGKRGTTAIVPPISAHVNARDVEMDDFYTKDSTRSKGRSHRPAMKHFGMLLWQMPAVELLSVVLSALHAWLQASLMRLSRKLIQTQLPVNHSQVHRSQHPIFHNTGPAVDTAFVSRDNTALQ